MNKFLTAIALSMALIVAGCGDNKPVADMASPVVNVSDSCTGVVIDAAEGLVLTAGHCVQPNMFVKTSNGYTVEADTLWKAEDNDVALLKIDYPNMTVLHLTSRSIVDYAPVEGQRISIWGFPLMLDKFYSEGYVSKADVVIKGRHLTAVSATCTYGCSGAPVFDRNGAILGILVGPIAVPAGFGLSIPTNYILLTPASVIRNHLGR